MKATGKSDRTIDGICTVLMILFWFVEWFMGNAVLRGFLRVRMLFFAN